MTLWQHVLAPWPWWVTGPLIGLTIPLLLLGLGRPLGISSNLQHLCSIVLPKTTIAYFRDNAWKKEAWNLFFALGVVLGGFLAVFVFSDAPVELLPAWYRTWPGLLTLLGGGLLVGFGTRWANGCTSGHSIMGMANLQWTSLVATIFFFIGGLSAAALDALIARLR